MEIELTPKRDRTEYDRKLSWYASQLHFKRVHWFAPSAALRDRLTRVSQTLRLTHMTIAPLPQQGDYPPGIIPNRTR